MITYILSKTLPENSYNRLYPLTYSIPSQQEVFDHKTKSRRIIRCCAGERSIFKDEQSPNSQVVRLIFNNGVLNVDERDVHKINYLNMCDYNLDNENRDPRVKAIFRVQNNNEDAKAENDYLDLAFESESIARGFSFDEMLDFCRGANISIDRGAEEIKHDVILLSREEPEYFLEMYNDPVVKRMSLMRKAEEEEVIYFDENKRQVYIIEGNHKRPVKVFSLGIDMRRAFAEWSFENEGKETFSHIQKMLDKDEVKTVKRTTRRTTKTEQQ